MMTAAYLKLEAQGLTKDPEVKAINKELRDILEVKTTSDIGRKSLPLRRRNNSRDSTMTTKKNSRSNSKERGSSFGRVERGGNENKLKMAGVKGGAHKKNATLK